MWKIRRFIGNVIRTIKWLPTIWNDRDYDYVYFFRLLEFKLIGMKKDAELVNDKQSEKIEYALKILRRINSDPYFDIAFMFYWDNWGETTFPISLKKPIWEQGENVITEKDKKLSKIEFRKCAEQERYLQDQDIEFLFKYLTKHIQCWWS